MFRRRAPLQTSRFVLKTPWRSDERRLRKKIKKKTTRQFPASDVRIKRLCFCLRQCLGGISGSESICASARSHETVAVPQPRSMFFTVAG